MVDDARRARRAPRKADAAIRAAAEITAQSARLYGQLLPFQSKDGKPSYTSPVTYPSAQDNSFPTRLAGARGDDRAPGSRSSASSLSAPGGYDTHGNQARRPDEEPEAHRRLALRVPARPRGARPRRIASSRSSGRSSAAAREENGSAGTDHGAAGTAFVIGSQLKGGMIGEFPGLGKGTGSTTTATCKATADFRGLYRTLLEQWFQVDAAAVLPDAASFAAGARSSGDRAPRDRRALLALARPPSRRACRSSRTSTRSRSRATTLPGRPGRDRARQLRDGPARPPPPAHRRRAHLRHAGRRSGRRARALRSRTCSPAATGCGARSHDHKMRGMKATLRVVRRP